MNNTQLRAFHAVAELGSVTKAAAHLHVTQPTVSDHIKGLEYRYGVKLFERRGRGVVLTGLGRALLDISRRAFSLEAEAEQLLSAAAGLPSGSLRVVADGPYLVVPVLGEFQLRHPKVEINLRFGNKEQVLKELFALNADVAIVPDLPEHDRLHRVVLGRDRLVCIVNRGHEFSRRRSIRLNEFSGQRLIMREPGSHTRELFERSLAASGIVAGHVLEVGSREGAREAVAQGLGMGVIVERELGSDRRIHALSIRDVNLRLTEYAVCLRETQPMPVINALLDVIRSLAGTEG